jgi:hypothetical protein
MKIEIERVTNGYIITIPPECEDSLEKKIVIQEHESNLEDDHKDQFLCFSELVSTLQDIFGVHSSKHKKIGYINGICSEHLRWDLLQQMEASLENPKNDNGD